MTNRDKEPVSDDAKGPRGGKPPLSPVTEAFGKRVKAVRLERGLTQEQLADLAGMHWTFIGQIERGRRNPTLETIAKLTTALDCDASTLIT